MAEGAMDKIDDMGDMLAILQILDIPQKGLQNLDEMKKKAKEKIHSEEQGNPSNNCTTGFSVISTAKDEDVMKRQGLSKLYSETKSCLDKMDDRVISVLNSEIPNIKATIEERQRRLKSREYYLLVAGESSAGKSSFLNLILGEDVLPSSVLSTTSTICELRYAKERSLVAHFKTKDPTSGLSIKRFKLNKPEDCGGISYLKQIAPYVHLTGDSREGGSAYKKVEIFWPHELLQKGIVIIDSPGIGESDVMDKTLMDYLPKAFAFIYVINSENAGGMQKDRIIRIFEEVRKRETDEEQKCLAECALFICNKWDLIPKEEKNKVKEHTENKLNKCWPDADPHSQIVYLSTKEVHLAKNYGIVSPFNQLMKRIGSMVLKAINARLHSHWGWLDRVLQRISQKTRAFICNAIEGHQSLAGKMDSITARIQEIQIKQHMVENDLKIKLSQKIRDTTSELSRHLQTEHFKKSFATWTENDAPREEKDWRLTKREITKAIEHRFGNLLQKWEDDHHLLANAHCSLVKEFLQRLNLIEEELQKIEVAFVSDNQENDFLLPMELGEREISTGVKIIAGVTSPLWFPLGVAGLILGIPVAGVIAAKKRISESAHLRKYQGNPCAYLENKSRKYLDSLPDEKFSEYVKNQMQETESVLKEYLERIPRLIESDKKLVLELNNENRTKEHVQRLYRPILLEISEIRKKLTEFAFNVHPPSIANNELDWRENEESVLGKTDSSTVFKATLKKRLPVAIKLLKESLDPANMRIFCKEEKILRNLKHPHVVKLYGTASVFTSFGQHMTFVMELCKGNLKNAIFNETTAAPAQNKKAIDGFFSWASQIADGLKYIHGQGLYHRHLSLENILVSQDGTLKISDVGIRAGTLMTERNIVYYAPEVIKYQSYDASADIYSLAVILWEMWYGKEVFSELKRPLKINNFIQDIHRGYRPHPPRSVVINLPKLQEFLQTCWDSIPERRPTACECYIKLVYLYQVWKGGDAGSSLADLP